MQPTLYYICIILYISIVYIDGCIPGFPSMLLAEMNLDSVDQNPPGPVNTIPVLHSVGRTLRRPWDFFLASSTIFETKSNVHSAISDH